jgi:uncharacterized protein (TIGR03435 family)
MQHIMSITTKVFLVVMLLLQTTVSSNPSFEVASIKPSPAQLSGRRFITSSPDGLFIATNYPLKALIMYAYRVRDYQLLGGTGWIETAGWEIQARAPGGIVQVPVWPIDITQPDPMGLMLQSLLEERFQLRIHREKKEAPVYELVVQRGGTKIRLSNDQSPVSRQTAPAGIPPLPGTGSPPLPRGGFRISTRELSRTFEASAVALSVLMNSLENELNRPIIDKTDLKGLYDINLQWSLDDIRTPAGINGPPTVNAPSLFTALQEQLGLRLVSSRGPVDVVVIDKAEKPSPN